MAAQLAIQSAPDSEFECPWEPPGLILEAPDPYFKAIWEDQASILSKRVHSIPFHAHHSFPKSKLLLLFLFCVDTLRRNCHKHILRTSDQSNKSLLNSVRAQVNAAEIANEGIVAEYNSGSNRTTLEVIQSNSLLLNAQISLADSERNYILSQFNLLKSVGQLNSEYLKIR